MKWEGKPESENIEDRRGRGGFRLPFPRGGGRGGGFRIPGGGGFPGQGGAKGGSLVGLIVIVVVLLLLGVDPRVLLEGGGGSFPLPGQTAPDTSERRAEADRMKRFAGVVLRKTEDVWTAQFRAVGRAYQQPKLVLFDNVVQSGCGMGQSQMGPFYCPLDQKLYLDFSFYSDLANRFKAPGDFAQAYVIAHEVGHHVQTLLGVTEKVMLAKQRMDKGSQNALQVKMELQADCYAGLWAHHAEKREPTLDEGDLEEALRAASAIGDDRLQRQAGGRVTPDSFTHGTAEQRSRWFRTGFQTGDLNACDTFKAATL
jgi:hypothetical protein